MNDLKPLVFDLFCGLGGWTNAFIAEGYRAIGFDIEEHDYGNGRYPGKLVLKDVRQISGAVLVEAYGIPACIVASPPCQEFSYMAMPWSKAKDKMRKILASPDEQKRLCELFNECFRIQREVSDASGRYVPIVIENVRGAQRWVGKARWNFGSYYLWGDVPALMPIPAKMVVKQPGRNFHFPEKYGIPSPSFHGHAEEPSVMRAEGVKAGYRNKGRKNGEHKWGTDWNDGTARSEGHKTAGMNWSDQSKRGQDFTRVAGRQTSDGIEQPSENGRRTDIGNGARFTTNCDGVKGFTPNGEPLGKNTLGRKHGSKSKARKQASAEIAKIPQPLAQWITRVFKPKESAIEKSYLI